MRHETAMSVRLIFADGEYLSTLTHVRKSPKKVFAVIGPFEGHIDKQDLQEALEKACRKFNWKVRNQS